MTPSLPELQRAFAADVFDDSGVVLAHVRDGAFPAARQLQVYRNNTFANLTDALAACFPVVQRLVGDEFFSFLAKHYIRNHPPRSGNLHEFGGTLPDFISGFEPARSLPYLADVARLEWAWQESYHAADAPILTPEMLAAVSPEHYPRMVFRLHPSARLIDSMFPCLRIWQVNQPEHDADAVVNLDVGAERLLVVRRTREVVIIALGEGEFALLQACAEGHPLGAATNAAFASDPTLDLGAVLRRHVTAGSFSGFDIAPTHNDTTENLE